MSNEIELISDGDGIAVFGSPSAVDQFFAQSGLKSREIDKRKLATKLSAGAGAAQVGAEVAANAGRWVKLTEESAQIMKVGQLMKGPAGSVGRAIVVDGSSKTQHILQVVQTPMAILTNPAALSGAAGIMSQIAMQQAMDEISEYLAVIEEKVDDILRAQKDSVLAEMIGVGLMIDEAMIVCGHTGRVSDITWSKIQNGPMIISSVQSYALRQLDAIAEKLEKRSKASELAEVSKVAEATVEEWLVVLARCFHLFNGLGVLELDRVLDAEPEELDQHRTALNAAREHRKELVSRTTLRLLERMEATADSANARALFNPFSSSAAVRSISEVAADVIDFHERIGISGEHDAIEAKHWLVAVGEVRDKAVETGTDTAENVRRFGLRAFGGALDVTEKVSNGLAERARRMRQATETAPEDETS